MMAIIFLLIFTFPIISHAQIHGGVKGGINMASFVGEHSEGSKFRTDYLGGIFLHHQIMQNFEIQAELLYSRKGARGERGINGMEMRDIILLEYIDVPVIAKFIMPQAGKTLVPGLLAGLFYSYNLNSELEVKSNGTTIQTHDLNGIIRKGDFGVLIGGQITFIIGSRLAGIEFRYTRGVTSIQKMEDIDLKNHVLSLTTFITLF